jgi:hypothetical protein
VEEEVVEEVEEVEVGGRYRNHQNQHRQDPHHQRENHKEPQKATTIVQGEGECRGREKTDQGSGNQRRIPHMEVEAEIDNFGYDVVTQAEAAAAAAAGVGGSSRGDGMEDPNQTGHAKKALMGEQHSLVRRGTA